MLRTDFYIWIKLVLSLLVILNSPSYLASQSYALRQYTPEDGLPSSTVYFADQDSKGVIWFGTENGLSSFDGDRFNNYSINDGLLGNLIYGVTIDHLDRIWLSTLGQNISYFKDGVIVEENWVSDAPIRHVMIDFSEFDSTNYFFIHTTEMKNNEFGRKGFSINQTENYPKEFQFNLINTNSPVFDWNGLSYTTSGQCKFIVLDSGEVIDSILNADLNMPKCKECISNENGVICFTQSENYSISVQGVVRVNFENRSSYPILHSLYEYLRLHDLGDLMLDRHNNLWISTTNDLVLVRDVFSDNPKIEFFLEDVSVNFSYEDHEGNIWIGTVGDGLYFLSSVDVNNVSDSKINGGASISTIEIDSSNNIWLGYTNGYIGILDSDFNVQFQKKISNSCIRDIEFIEGLTYVLSDIEIFSIDHSKNVEFLTYGSAFKTMLFAGSDLYVFSFLIQKFKEDKLVDLKFDRQNRIYNAFTYSDSIIWLGSTVGMFKYNLYQEMELGLVHPELNLTVAQVVYGDVYTWVSTTGKGVYQFQQDSIVFHYTSENGLASDICYYIILQDSILWVASNSGIDKISLHSGEITTLTKKDGLINSELFHLKLFGDNLLASGDNGLDVIPLSSVGYSKPPLVSIRGSQVNGEHKAIHESSLAHRENNIQIDYQVVSFKSQGDLVYAFKLNTLNGDWIETPSPIVNFNALSPGHYELTFKTRGKNTDWGSPSPIRFTIAFPWWQTWWFIIVGTLSLLFGVSLIFRAVLARQKERNRIEQQLKDLELTALRAQMNPHFLFNALNSINWFVNRNDADSANLYMAKFALLIRKILANSGKQFISLSEEIEQLELYLELENLRMDNSINYSIDLPEDVDADWVMLPGMLIQPYVENAILHGLVPQEGLRDLSVSFNLKNENYLECLVVDSGIGIDVSRNRKLEMDEPDRPHAMEITGKRLELINIPGKLQVKLKAEQLIDPVSKKVLGTKIELIIPIKNNLD